ncbi:MAG: hypothetical protein LUD15_11375 [Bacteroides sp.]|nr:hypothetical protein [Bacteroides sp.]
MEPVPEIEVPFTADLYPPLSMRIHLLWYNLLYESFLLYGTDLHHYRILSRQTKGVIALFRIPGTREWLIIGHFYEKETLIHTVNLFCSFFAGGEMTKPETLSGRTSSFP